MTNDEKAQREWAHEEIKLDYVQIERDTDIANCYCDECEELNSTCDEELTPEFERYLKRWYKRTGIFRMYLLDQPRKRSQLLLEFVIRGRVLFNIKLWKRRQRGFN